MKILPIITCPSCNFYLQIESSDLKTIHKKENDRDVPFTIKVTVVNCEFCGNQIELGDAQADMMRRITMPMPAK